MKTCLIHNVKFSEKSPNSKGRYWHVVDFDKQEYHSIKGEEYMAIEDAVAPQNQPIAQSMGSFPTRDYDAENRGKVRNSMLAAKIKFEGLKMLTEQDLAILEGYVDWVMGDDKKEEKAFP